MRPPVLLAFFALAVVAAVPASRADAPAADPRARFAALELEWMDALAAKDAATLERLLAPEFSIIGATSSAEDAVGTRAQWLELGLARPFPRHEVQVLGATVVGDVAVVQAVLRGTYPPSPFAPEGGPVAFLVTDTWLERDGRWQVLARHSSFPSAGGTRPAARDEKESGAP